MFEPAKLLGDALDGIDVDARRRDVGAEPVERQHRRRERELLPDVGHPERVEEGARARGLPLDQDAGAARGLDLLARAGGEAVRVDGQRLRELALAEHLDRHVACAWRAPAAQRVRGDLGAVVEAASRSRRLTGWVWVRNFSNGIDFFMCGPRSLRIRMWIGFWPPSKPTFFLAPERCARALLAAARGLAEPGALAAADALARVARAGRRLQVVEPDPRPRGAVSHRRPPRGGRPRRPCRGRSGRRGARWTCRSGPGRGCAACRAACGLAPLAT